MLAILLLQSCALFKKEADKTYPTQEPVAKEKKDSTPVIIEEIVIGPQDDEHTTKKDSSRDEKEELKKEMRMAIILPFDADAVLLDDAHSLVMYFYQGLKSGLYAARLKGAKLTVDVYDSKSPGFNFQKLAEEFRRNNTDLILGGLMKQSIASLSQIALNDSIPFVCPLYPTNGIVENNPFHIQVNPGFDAHMARLQDHILRQHPDARIFIIGRKSSSEVARVNKILRDLEASDLDTSVTRIEHILIDWKDENSDISFENELHNFQKHVFIIPSWSSETFVYHVLRQLSIDKKESEILVFGMPQWKSFDLISPEYLEKLQVHVSAGSYIDDPDVETNLERSIFKVYNDIPSEKEVLAYAVGADVGQYFAEMLRRNKPLTEIIREVKYYGKAVHFAFPGATEPDALTRDIIPATQRLENYGVKLLKFSDWQYKVLK